MKGAKEPFHIHSEVPMRVKAKQRLFMLLTAGEARPCAAIRPQRMLLQCDGDGCFYVGYDEEAQQSSIYYISQQSLESELVFAGLPHTTGLSLAGDRLFFTDDGAQCFSVRKDGTDLKVELAHFSKQGFVFVEADFFAEEPSARNRYLFFDWDGSARVVLQAAKGLG